MLNCIKKKKTKQKEVLSIYLFQPMMKARATQNASIRGKTPRKENSTNRTSRNDWPNIRGKFLLTLFTGSLWVHKEEKTIVARKGFC
jgi:hypothetical protein